MFKPLLKSTHRNRGPFKSLFQDERGVTAIEFGLLAFPFFGIIAAILQTSMIFMATQVLDSAVSDASRLIRTGQLQRSTLATFRDNICDRLYGLFPDCNQLHVQVSRVTDFQSATVVPPIDPACTEGCGWTETESWDPGDGLTVMAVEVYYRYPVLIQLGPLGMANLPDGTRLLGSAAVFQNEPF